MEGEIKRNVGKKYWKKNWKYFPEVKNATFHRV
jgi:hypothetical protein